MAKRPYGAFKSAPHSFGKAGYGVIVSTTGIGRKVASIWGESCTTAWSFFRPYFVNLRKQLRGQYSKADRSTPAEFFSFIKGWIAQLADSTTTMNGSSRGGALARLVGEEATIYVLAEPASRAIRIYVRFLWSEGAPEYSNAAAPEEGWGGPHLFLA